MLFLYLKKKKISWKIQFRKDPNRIMLYPVYSNLLFVFPLFWGSLVPHDVPTILSDNWNMLISTSLQRQERGETDAFLVLFMKSNKDTIWHFLLSNYSSKHCFLTLAPQCFAVFQFSKDVTIGHDRYFLFETIWCLFLRNLFPNIPLVNTTCMTWFHHNRV